jgi:hypothetical protein
MMQNVTLLWRYSWNEAQIEYAKKLLGIYIDNVKSILDADFGVAHAESAMFDVIYTLQANGMLKQYFLERVKDTLARVDCWFGEIPTELIELAVHELRWPEFLELSKKRINDFWHGDAVFAMGDVAGRMLEAYNDDWEGREFYPHYTHYR